MRKPLALIFEDEPIIVMSIESSLKAAGFAVASEPSCVRARQILALVQPDVVILDVLLRDCVSSSVAEELVARNIPFVIYSATDIEGRGEAFKAGTFVEKPADECVLAALASSLAAHRAPRTLIPWCPLSSWFAHEGLDLFGRAAG
ncbi:MULTISPECIES: response regulator [Mesorhizobium]|uniref:response regulator n=1 Tax=Mesorhizobium TaxID=68287 RepID=UPI0008008E4D|nr:MULTISPECIES: response regulator [Mesorhizobium]PBB52523.1 hypothetical protein CK223_29225 [Mesorhizobium loti]QIA25513.1 response regulator [Mesorhizobium sp. AA22]